MNPLFLIPATFAVCFSLFLAICASSNDEKGMIAFAAGLSMAGYTLCLVVATTHLGVPS